MSEKVYKFLNDNPVARWSALVLIASMMFFAYMFVDVMSLLGHMRHLNTSSTYAVSSSLRASSWTRWAYASPVF